MKMRLYLIVMGICVIWVTSVFASETKTIVSTYNFVGTITQLPNGEQREGRWIDDTDGSVFVGEQSIKMYPGGNYSVLKFGRLTSLPVQGSLWYSESKSANGDVKINSTQEGLIEISEGILHGRVEVEHIYKFGETWGYAKKTITSSGMLTSSTFTGSITQKKIWEKITSPYYPWYVTIYQSFYGEWIVSPTEKLKGKLIIERINNDPPKITDQRKKVTAS